MDDDVVTFARTFTRFMEAMTQAARGPGALSPLGETVAEHLGTDPRTIDAVTESFPPLLTVDVDRALTRLSDDGAARWIGVQGSFREGIDGFHEMLTNQLFRLEQGPVSYARTPIGPGEETRVVAFGILLGDMDGVPLAALVRGPHPRYGREDVTVEVLAAEPEAADRFLADMREIMASSGSFRGRVVSFHLNHFTEQASGNGLTFLERPSVTADQVILPDGVLDRIVRHVVGIGERRESLTAAGQHLKRGVLLHGPPGTGKTHVIRHLLAQTPDTTAVLLSGRTLDLLPVATRLARANQPALIVLEDCDLIAEERGGDTNAALFETLEALDGLDGDADVTFVLTTNRPDLLERALLERPGRVDLAVHIDRPELEARRRLLRLYAGDLALSDAAIDAAAERTEGATASLAKELIRRCVIRAAQHDRDVSDDDLKAALDEIMSDGESLTRSVLGAADAASFRAVAQS